MDCAGRSKADCCCVKTALTFMESSRIHISAMSYYARARDGCGLFVYPERTLKGRHLTAGWKIGLRQRQRWALLGVLQFQRSPVMSGTFHGRATERRSEEHTSELQSLMRTSYAGFRLTTKTDQKV